MAVVEIKKITKIFEEDVTAVDNVDLHVNDKEFLVLVGPSGCGKSTILRMIAGLEQPSGGEIYIGDNLMNNVLPKNRNIAMVFQNYALYPHMTVYDNMAYSLKLKKFKKDEIKNKVHEAAEILEISELLERKPGALSGGQRQRVALGRSIVRNPKVFLFDEPLSNLDAKLRVQMRTEIKKLHKKLETTMIYVTHDQTEAMTMGDRIAVLKDGKLQQVGTPLEVYTKPKNHFVAGFIGAPSMNFISGKIENDIFTGGNLNLPLENVKAKDGLEGNVIFGIRPENIHITPKGKFKLPLVLTEPLGNETIFHITVGNQTVLATSKSKEDHSRDTSINVDFDMHEAHFFDVSSGENCQIS